MNTAARAEDELTAEELAELRAALPLLRALRHLVKSGVALDATPKPAVNPKREPPAEAFERMARLRKRKGLD